MTKNYNYLGYRYFYSRQYHKWIVEGECGYYYCDSKEGAIELIMEFDEENNEE